MDVPTLRGERVLLRAPNPVDVTELVDIRMTPEVQRWWDPPDRDWPLASEGELVWVVELDGLIIGYVEAFEETEPMYRHANIDLALAPAYHGQGLGVDVVRTVATYLTRELGHHRLTIDPAANNVRAIRCYEKVGFRPVGVMRQYERDPNGDTWHDGLLMDLLAEDLR